MISCLLMSSVPLREGIQSNCKYILKRASNNCKCFTLSQHCLNGGEDSWLAISDKKTQPTQGRTPKGPGKISADVEKAWGIKIHLTFFFITINHLLPLWYSLSFFIWEEDALPFYPFTLLVPSSLPSSPAFFLKELNITWSKVHLGLAVVIIIQLSCVFNLAYGN